ncbi:hypothetical protein GXW78_10330 [Roseomonas terrae]|jgi:hypothetical protein|uniref:Uncharacterized protein n=1 Tax=Neoroseomonas terrae TaxID=424799 RepID=A0ABS5EGA3_9PROT|nr:hypothetical protein [Neoroseomonas terrae]MBR0650059.1 hypothetical protein [Neoroseomonas terrae]
MIQASSIYAVRHLAAASVIERDHDGVLMPSHARSSEAASSPNANGKRIAGAPPIPSMRFF